MSMTCHVFSVWVFFQEHSRFTGQQVKGEAIYFKSSVPLPPVFQTLKYGPGFLNVSLFQMNTITKPLRIQ